MPGFSDSERLPRWPRPALVLCGLAPLGAAAAWVVTRWQIGRDENCAHAATHASCGLTAGGAALVVGVSAVVAAIVASTVGWWGRRTHNRWAGWLVVGVWLLLTAVYLALPPSG